MFNRVTFRQWLQLIAGSMLVGLIVLYGSWQARFLLAGPELAMEIVPPTATESRTIELSGYASNIVALTLNDREIFTNRDGYFKETIVLENGYTTMTLAAFDRYGREATETYGVVYTPAMTRDTLTN